MRIDVSPKQIRRGTRPQRVAVMAVILAIGVVLGAALGGLRPAAEGTLSGMARTLVDGPTDDRLPQLLLDVHFRQLQTLRDRRQALRTQGLRPSPEPSAVLAGIRQGSRRLDAALSLLGPAQSRAPGELGRLQVELRGEGDYAGMRAFTLEDPDQPTLLRELMLYHALDRVGAIAPRTQAVGVRVNGARWGAAVLVEQPSSAMLRAAHRPLGALVGWEAVLPAGVDLDTAGWLLQPQAARWSTSARGLQGTPLESHTAWAESRLDGLRAGTLAPEAVLDIEATARLMALAELTGLADRVLDWQSLRWYLNPISLRLEPVVHLDAESAGPRVRADALLPRLMASAPIRQVFQTMLRAEAERLLAPDTHLRLERHLHATWPTLASPVWQRQWLVVRQRAMRLLAAERVPVEAMLPPPVVFLPQEVTDAHLALPFAVDVGPVGGHALLVPAGVWTVPTTVALPEGWRLEIAAGAKLRFGANAWLVLHGGLTIAGTADAPVELAAEGTQAWGGVVVLGAHQSHIQALHVSGANGQGRDVWQPGAALVWLDGDVDATALTMTGGPQQNAGIRVVGGHFHAADLRFTDISGPALRLDDVHAQLTQLQVEQGGSVLARAGQFAAVLPAIVQCGTGVKLEIDGRRQACEAAAEAKP